MIVSWGIESSSFRETSTRWVKNNFTLDNSFSIDPNSYIIYRNINLYYVINRIIILQHVELKSRGTIVVQFSNQKLFFYRTVLNLNFFPRDIRDRRNEIGMLHVSRQSSIVSRDGKLKNRRGGRNTIPSTRLSCSWASDKGISNKMYENTSEEWIWEFRFPVSQW